MCTATTSPRVSQVCTVPAVGALQLHDLGELAFERDRALRHPGHADEPARHRRQAGDLELVDVVGDMRRSGVHLLRQILVARFQTNSPVSWMLPTLSFHE